MASHEVAGKMTAGATIFEALQNENLLPEQLLTESQFPTTWHSSCGCLTS